jgi:hypothetical protein
VLQLLKYSEINKKKWDACVQKTSGPSIYAMSWYLDVVHPQWNAVIYGDYLAVMPITNKKKYSLSYVITPAFTQQLGVLGDNKLITNELINQFINFIKPYFLQIIFNFNESNIFVHKNTIECPNYCLNLKANYLIIKENYSENTLRNIKKANKNKLDFEISQQYEVTLAFLNFYSENLPKSAKNINQNILKKLVIKANENHSIFFGVLKFENIICAMGAFLVSENRIIFLAGTSNEVGKGKGAMHFLFDKIIASFAGKPLILDFEGGKGEGMRKFYAGFGSESKPYLQLNCKNYWSVLNLFKKL